MRFHGGDSQQSECAETFRDAQAPRVGREASPRRALVQRIRDRTSTHPRSRSASPSEAARRLPASSSLESAAEPTASTRLHTRDHRSLRSALTVPLVGADRSPHSRERSAHPVGHLRSSAQPHPRHDGNVWLGEHLRLPLSNHHLAVCRCCSSPARLHHSRGRGALVRIGDSHVRGRRAHLARHERDRHRLMRAHPPPSQEIQ